MSDEITKWVTFFQGLIFTKFRHVQVEALETLTGLVIGHLFGLYNLNQLADALEIPKSALYEHLSEFSLHQWKRMLLVIGCTAAVERIKQTESMSAATKSRRRITLSVDDTVQQRSGKILSYCYHWYSGRFHKTLNGQNLLAVTIKIGDEIIPLGVRLVAKQGRANTEKPKILVDMMADITTFFKKHDIDITSYPITFDSWYGSQPLREDLEEIGFSQILVHAKSNYVFTIGEFKAKLSVHKHSIHLKEAQWGCSRAQARKSAESPTFGQLVLLFFKDGGQLRCMMVFGRPLRAAEILSIWSQHHSIEQFWRSLKSTMHLKAMTLRGRHGAYAGVAVKVLSYLLISSVAQATGLTREKILFTLSAQRAILSQILEHFHGPNPVRP